MTIHNQLRIQKFRKKNFGEFFNSLKNPEILKALQHFNVDKFRNIKCNVNKH